MQTALVRRQISDFAGYVAMHMLVGVLQDIDGQLGDGAVTACKHDSLQATGMYFDSLGKKATTIKELLGKNFGF